MKSWYQLRMYWKHLFLTRHRGGHGVHSPLLFELITRVIEEKCAYYCYEDIEANLSADDKSSLSMPAAQLLFRLLNFWQPAQCQTWFSAPDARRDAYVQQAVSAFRAQASRRALVVDLSAYSAEALPRLYDKLASALQEARTKDQASMLILLHPHSRSSQRQFWRRAKQDLQCPVVLDCYDLAILLDASTLSEFSSKLRYC